MSVARKELLEEAIEAGWKYIQDKQSNDGRWTDWELPPGSSSTWTTAYIGYKLRLLPTRLAKNLERAGRTAAEWLLANEFPGGGWGYNASVGIDADSTAYAILFLVSQGFSAPQESYRQLKSFQQPDGGFSTYQSSDNVGSWGCSNLDVSAVVLSALMTESCRGREITDRGIEYVLRQRSSQGLWNSFWWKSALYGTDASLALIQTAAAGIEPARTRKALTHIVPENPFESALLVSSLARIAPDDDVEIAWPIVDRLIKEQQADGSWKSEPMLRITYRNCFEPWTSKDAGPLYSDPARLFTSSTVLGSLCQVRALL